jgi:hypothetical protein
VRLTNESRRTRWLILTCAWTVIAWLATIDTLAVRDYVALLDDSGTIAADSLPLRRPLPADYADAQSWVRFALSIEEGGPSQVRHTDIDNAPTGREVHWNSAFAHLVAIAGRVRRAATGEPLATATERSLAWFNLPLFLVTVMLISAWVTRRVGAAGGVLIAFGMVGLEQFYAGFAPNYVDHHGLLSAASLGVALGALFMGAGWWRSNVGAYSMLPHSREHARVAAVVSAMSGAIGMWVGAASAIPTIAIVGIAGLASTWWLGARAREEGAQFDGDLWKTWGRVGAGISLLAYLVEYAPHHMGMRLEVNHPLYAMAWLGGGELIAMIGEWRVARIRPPAWRAVFALLAFVAAPLAIVVGGARVFIPLDSRVAHLHETISEFRSMLSLVRAHEWHTLARYAIAVVLMIPALLVFKARQRDRALIAFAAFTVVGCAALAFWQVRWWLVASGPELSLLLLVVAMLVGQRNVRVRWAVVLCISAVFAAQAGARVRLTRSNVASGAVSEADATEPLYRDVASAVRTSQPAGDVILLANPNASTGIGYFGRFKTLGTLYWENADGLGAAAAIYSARTDDEARRQLSAHGVTHIAMIGGGEYLLSYLVYAHPGAQRDELARTFGARLQARDIPPRWLRPVPLRARAGSQPIGLTARILQVVPEQTEFEALWADAVTRAAAGEETMAAQEFRTAIALAPAAQRAELMEQAATAAYRWHAHRLALDFFGATASHEVSRSARVAAAWILAVSADDSVRNGNAAMDIIRPLALASPNDPAILDVVAAALAETGHFPDAISVVERVVLLYRTLGDVGAETRARAHLESYRASRPWRV